MDSIQQPENFSFDGRLSRSKGRLGRTHVAQARVTETEQLELEAAARASGKALSEWSREVLLREARRPKQDPVLTELIGNRLLMGNLFLLLADDRRFNIDTIKQAHMDAKRDKFKAAEIIMQQYVQLPTPEVTNGK